MKNIKKTIVPILTAMILAVVPMANAVKAEGTVYDPKGLIALSDEELETAISGIVGAITTNNVNALGSASNYLTTGTLYELQQFVQESKTHGTLVRMHIDRINQSGSSDNDIVIMATAITNITGYEYYTLYEFHVDTEQGKIYGYNIWVY